MPLAWAEAGAAPFWNIIGDDPGLRDPEQGDFRADLAPGYGCRVFGPRDEENGPEPATAPRAVPRARPGRLKVGGTIDVDTVWDAAEVTVLSEVDIVGGATLTIAAGARIVFGGYSGVNVRDGSLQACGLPEAPIVWTSQRPDLWQPDTSPLGAWRGLAFLDVPAARDSSRLRWCVLEHAKALPGSGFDDGLGGAVRVVGFSPLLVSHCVLRRNLAERGGAVAVHRGGSPLLVNNLMHDNHATLRGAGLYASNSYPVLVHNTWTGNVTAAPSPWTNTGCVDHAHAKPRHLGNVIWGNPTTNFEHRQIRGARAYYVRYCNIDGWLGGEGCQTDDPLLDPLSEPPYQPALSSPVVDAGSLVAVAHLLPGLDLAGGQRVVGASVDIGAFEHARVTAAPSVPPPALLTLIAAPNPFNPRTVLRWYQPVAAEVRLDIHDARGRRVRVLVDEPVTAGWQEAIWDGRAGSGLRLAAGAYLARVRTADGRTTAVKLMLAP